MNDLGLIELMFTFKNDKVELNNSTIQKKNGL